MRRKTKDIPDHMTPEEALLNDLKAEALAHQLDERKVLHVWLVFFLPPKFIALVEHRDTKENALKGIKEALEKGAFPAGYVLLEQVSDASKYCQWSIKPNPYYEDAPDVLRTAKVEIMKRCNLRIGKIMERSAAELIDELRAELLNINEALDKPFESMEVAGRIVVAFAPDVNAVQFVHHDDENAVAALTGMMERGGNPIGFAFIITWDERQRQEGLNISDKHGVMLRGKMLKEYLERPPEKRYLEYVLGRLEEELKGNSGGEEPSE